MGIFSPTGVNYSEPLDIENMTYIESAYEDPFEGGMAILAESENNYNSIMKAVALDELYVLESTGMEIVYEDGRIKSFLQKVKEFFVKLWEKVKGIFAKFFAKMSSLITKDKEFVKKYKKQVVNAKLTDFEFDGYKFTNVDGAIPGQSAIESLPGFMDLTSISVSGDLKKLKDYVEETMNGDNYDDAISTYRQKLLGASSKVDSDEYAEELFKYFRDGEDSKSTLDMKDIDRNKVLNEIESTSEVKKAGEKALKAFKDIIDPIIKKLDKAEKEALKEVPGENQVKGEFASARAAAYSKTCSIYKDCTHAAELFTTAKLKAIKDRNRQARAIVVKMISYKPKNESAGFVYNEGGSFLDSVQIR